MGWLALIGRELGEIWHHFWCGDIVWVPCCPSSRVSQLCQANGCILSQYEVCKDFCAVEPDFSDILIPDDRAHSSDNNVREVLCNIRRSKDIGSHTLDRVHTMNTHPSYDRVVNRQVCMRRVWTGQHFIRTLIPSGPRKLILRNSWVEWTYSFNMRIYSEWSQNNRSF